ncbi:MAG TPA: hypothetical protein VF458_08040 [Ktedonobacteraceae bacterium]
MKRRTKTVWQLIVRLGLLDAHTATVSNPWLVPLVATISVLVVAWAFGYNLVLIPLAILSPLVPFLLAQAPVFAAAAMACSSVLVVTNALRLRQA